MTKFITAAGVCLMLATGAAFAQTGGGTGGTGGPASEANTQPNQQNPARPNTNLPSGTSGITTQSTTPATERPTEAQCRAGWDSSLRWTREEFDAACR